MTATTRIARTLAAVLVAGGAVLAVAGPASAETLPVSAHTSGEYGEYGESGESAETGTSFRFDGAQNGTLADASTSCIGGGIWEVTGNLHGAPVDLFVTFSQGDPGAGEFPMDVGLDPEHGLTTVTVDDQHYVSDSGGQNTGTFTVDPGARSGSLDVQTSTTDQTDTVHVQGTWSCS